MRVQSQRKLRKPGAFTLLEAILALGLFAVAVVGLFQALNDISLATIESAEASQVTERMRTYLTEILRNPRLLPGETETDPDESGFVYRAIVEEMPMQTQEGKEMRQMYTVRVQALRQMPKGGADVIDQAETFRYAPLYRQ
jgi:hypothetical protein